MDKKIAGVIGALTVLGGANVATAEPARAPAVADVMEVNSYADLLQPIPNALALLQASDAALQAKKEASGEDGDKANVELAQYHHHHHHHWRRWHHHHHHWHHHHHHHYY